MRVFAVKLFAKFQKQERISDAALCAAIARAERGLVDADLGHGLIKQRLARPGKGRSGGYRTLVAYRSGERALFLFGFAKSERANISKDELDFLAMRGAVWLSASEEIIETAIGDAKLKEVHCE
jgi:hypothetical protein